MKKKCVCSEMVSRKHQVYYYNLIFKICQYEKLNSFMSHHLKTLKIQCWHQIEIKLSYKRTYSCTLSSSLSLHSIPKTLSFLPGTKNTNLLQNWGSSLVLCTSVFPSVKWNAYHFFFYTVPESCSRKNMDF